MMMKLKYLLFSIPLITITVSAQDVDEKQLQKLLITESAISNLYVEPIETEKLVESAIRGMLSELDPHSTYLTAEEVEKSNETLQGNFNGIGIQFNMVEDTLFVVQPLPDGPSERAGILAGDRIVEVNDTVIAGVGMSDQLIMKRLRGPKDTMVKLGVKRYGLDEVLTFEVIRDKIPINTVDVSYMASPEIGYIKISSFGVATVEEFETALSDLKSKGAKSLILDLQENGGGYLMAAVGIANEFLKKDQMIVYTQGNRSPKSGYVADGSGNFLNGKLVILIDEYSASATEIVSGAVQDWDRGTIVGRRSFGKGLVQRPIEFEDGSMIRLTIAKYFTPAGRCIQKPYGEDIDYSDDILKRFNQGELTNADSIHFPDSLKYSTLVEHRTVYGGGGIMPDYFVPLDTTKTNLYYRQLTAKGVVLQTTLSYVESQRKQLLRKYKNFEQFCDMYQPDKKLIDLLLEKAASMKIEYNEKEYNECLPIINVQLKALLARNLWSMKEYYQIINDLDDSIRKGIELLD